MSSQMVFKRVEMKYLLTRKQKEQVLKAMEPYMALDAYGRSTIRNIYYDTDNFRLIRRSLEKPIYKEKLRVRSYREANADTPVFVELKKKYDGIVYKRRVDMKAGDAEKYLAGKIASPVHGQISEEMDYFLEFYETLAPKVFLSYEREAYYTKVPSEFRVTFDENILWRETDLSLAKGAYGTSILSPGMTLMEIKTPGGIPLWMVDVMTAQGITKVSFSKYGNAYEQIMNERKGEYYYA